MLLYVLINSPQLICEDGAYSECMLCALPPLPHFKEHFLLLLCGGKLLCIWKQVHPSYHRLTSSTFTDV